MTATIVYGACDPTLSDDISVNQDRAMQCCEPENAGCADLIERCAADAGRAALSRNHGSLELSHFENIGVSGRYSLEPSCCPELVFALPCRAPRANVAHSLSN